MCTETYISIAEQVSGVSLKESESCCHLTVHFPYTSYCSRWPPANTRIELQPPNQGSFIPGHIHLPVTAQVLTRHLLGETAAIVVPQLLLVFRITARLNHRLCVRVFGCSMSTLGTIPKIRVYHHHQYYLLRATNIRFYTQLCAVFCLLLPLSEPMKVPERPPKPQKP